MIRCAVSAVSDSLALVAETLFHLPGKVRRVNKLTLTRALPLLAVCHNPDISKNARIIEKLVGQADNRFESIVLNDPTANVALAASGVTRKQWRTVEDDADARTFAALFGRVVHLRDHVQQEKQSTVIDTRKARTETPAEA